MLHLNDIQYSSYLLNFFSYILSYIDLWDRASTGQTFIVPHHLNTFGNYSTKFLEPPLVWIVKKFISIVIVYVQCYKRCACQYHEFIYPQFLPLKICHCTKECTSSYAYLRCCFTSTNMLLEWLCRVGDSCKVFFIHKFRCQAFGHTGRRGYGCQWPCIPDAKGCIENTERSSVWL